MAMTGMHKTDWTDPRREVRVGLLGHGIAASRTPRMHMEEGRAQGLAYEYRLYDMAGQDPEPEMGELLDRLEAEGLNGLNVTFPYKQRVIPHLDELSDAATAVGAVNTVVFRSGQRLGHNTDFWGFGESFSRGLPGAARGRVLLLGAGGAGGAVANALLDRGVSQLFLHDRAHDAAMRLASQLRDRFGADRAIIVADLTEAAGVVDGMVNATPMGMEKLPGMAIAADAIEPRHWVADIVYFPLETELLATARAKGCRVLSGSGMAVFQAVRAFELFTGIKADPERMRATFDSFTAEASA